jgi:sugar O-acyltransferase (sialic acid O-acetyltransferase NeuD family)
MSTAPVLVYGAGGFGREVAWLAESCGRTVVGFIDDAAAPSAPPVNGLPVMSLEAAARKHPDGAVALGIGPPAVRAKLATRVTAAGLTLTGLIHPRVERSRFIEYGEAPVICAGNILTTNIKFGDHIQINLDCTIGHDVTFGDYVTLAPGVHVSGWVVLETGVYVGTGAVLINGTQDQPLVVGAGAIVGAGACVVGSLPAGVTAVGVPAKARAPK